MKRLILVLSFLSISLSIFAQKSSFSIGVSAYNHINDRYWYQFNQFSMVFKTASPIYRLLNFHLAYTYKIDSLYSLTLANDLFKRTYRQGSDFTLYEQGLEIRTFSTTTLCLSRDIAPQSRSVFKFRGVAGIAFRAGGEYFNKGSIFKDNNTYTVSLLDLGFLLGAEVRYNLSKRFFTNANLNFINYVVGKKQRERPSIFNKSWTVFQANFSVGVNF